MQPLSWTSQSQLSERRHWPTRAVPTQRIVTTVFEPTIADRAEERVKVVKVHSCGAASLTCLIIDEPLDSQAIDGDEAGFWFLANLDHATSNGLQFTGANRDAMKQGSRKTVKQRFASGATVSWTTLSRYVGRSYSLRRSRQTIRTARNTRAADMAKNRLPHARCHSGFGLGGPPEAHQ